jgi:hypothetical protein
MLKIRERESRDRVDGNQRRLSSVPEPLVHYIKELLSTPESFKLRKKESGRIVEPVRRVIGTMGRQENILHRIKRMAVREWLLIKNVQGDSSDFIF